MARRRQAVTIKHVAADAGVSLQTVSRVINAEPNVRDQMRERRDAMRGEERRYLVQFGLEPPKTADEV